MSQTVRVPELPGFVRVDTDPLIYEHENRPDRLVIRPIRTQQGPAYKIERWVGEDQYGPRSLSASTACATLADVPNAVATMGGDPA